MEQESNRKSKSWLYRLKYLKMWRSNSNSSEAITVNNQRFSSSSDQYNDSRDINATTIHHPVVFRRTLTTASLDENIQNQRPGNQLRKNLRRWHKRIKSCFSKNSRHISQRQIIHITHAPASSHSSRITLSTPSTNRENIYSLDPLIFQRRSRSPTPEILSNSTVSPSPSRQTVTTDSYTTPSRDTCGNVPKDEVSSLAYCVWYWGPASRSLVEAKLEGAPDGSFLVRDSSSDRYIFSISFRSVGTTLHSRVEYTSRSGYKLFDHAGYSSVKELIEHAIEASRNGIYCYTKNRFENLPNYPVRLTKPISRYDQVRSLQNLARFVIRQNVNLNDIDKLCLPATLLDYLKENTIF